jgi:general secretion pathway protein H
MTPTSARASLTKDKGFTLVEILVVVVIMAVVISLAILSIGVSGHDSQLDDESRRIEGLMGLLHERAVLEGRDFGVRLEPNSYEFLVYNSFRDRWERITQELEYRRRDLPRGLSFQLELDSQVVVLKAPDKDLSTDALPNPQLAIAASGEGTPFRLTLVRDQTNAQASVDGDAMGKLSHETSDQRKQQDKRS